MNLDPPELPSLLSEYDEKYGLYSEFTQIIEALVKVKTNNSVLFKVQNVTSRIKARDSLADKIRRRAQGRYSSLGDVTDVAGVRIITYYKSRVDSIANVIVNEFKIDKENSSDKRIRELDKFGYESVHYVVSLRESRINKTREKFRGMKAEVQISTLLQHAYAEVEHDLNYKPTGEVPQEIERHFYRIAAVLDLVDNDFLRLTQLLATHDDRLAEIIKQEPLSQPIYAPTIRAFIATNPVVRELDERISLITGHEKHFSEELESKLIENLRALGITDYLTLETLLKENADDIVSTYRSMNESWLKIKEVNPKAYGNGSSPRGTCIYYLQSLLQMRGIDPGALQ